MTVIDQNKEVQADGGKPFGKSDGQVYVSTFNGAIVRKIFGGETERIVEKVSLDVEEIMRFINLKFTLF